MSVEIIELGQTFLNDVLTELGEGDALVGSEFLKNLLELGTGIGDVQLPVVDQQRRALDELSLVDHALTSLIDGLEVLPELVVESQVDQGKLECTSTHQTFDSWVLAPDFEEGGLVGSHDDWLGVKEFWQFEDISESLVDLCQREPVVAVDIKASKDLLPGCDARGI